METIEQLTLELTQRCPNQCVHCSTVSTPKAYVRLPIYVAKGIVADARGLGLKKLILSGGEPLLYPELEELLDYANELRVENVIIYTAGSILDANGFPASVSTSTIDGLLERGVKRFNVSLHSANLKVHDDFMLTPGSWSRAVDFIEHVHRKGADVEIHCVLTRENVDGVSGLALFLEEKGLKILRLLRFVPQGRGAQSFANFAPLPDDLRRARVQIEAWRSNAHSLSIRLGAHLSSPFNDKEYECSLDSGKLLVSPNGALSVCPALKGLHTHLGRRNVVDDQLGNILNSDWRKGVSDLKGLHAIQDCPAQVIYKQVRVGGGEKDALFRPAPLSDLMLLGTLELHLQDLKFPVDLEGKVKTFVEKATAYSKTSKIFSLFDYAGEAQKNGGLPSLYDLWINVLQASLSVLNSFDLRQNPGIHSGKNDALSLTPAIIDQMAKYYRKLGEFESVLYGSDPWYRDHVVHVLRVWLLGLRVIFDLPNARISDPPVTEIIEIDRRLFSREELIAAFSVAALTHDIGYPLEKVSKVNAALAKVLEAFGGLDWSPSTVGFSRPRYDIAQQLLRLLSSKPEFRKEDGGPLDEKQLRERTTDRLNQYKSVRSNSDLREKHKLGEWGAVFRTQWKYFQKYLDSFERNDHGFLSALLLLQKLLFFKEGEFAIEEDYFFSLEEARQFMVRREILRACATHTCPDIYILDPTSIEGLLFFVDEIQEWGRPAFRDLYSGKRVSVTPRVSLFEYSRMRVSWEVEVERLDDSSAAFWLMSAGRKLFDRLRTAPEWGERDFEIEWRLVWGADGGAIESCLRSNKDESIYTVRRRGGEKELDLMSFVGKMHRGEEMDKVRRDVIEELRAMS